MPRYVVMTAVAKMPTSCWGRYRRVAVLELEPGFEGSPKFISERARGVARVVATWEKCNVGERKRSAYVRALAAAHALVAELSQGAA